MGERASLDPARTSVLIVDTQNDFLSEGGAVWDLVGAGVKETKVVEHLVELRQAAQAAYTNYGFIASEIATTKEIGGRLAEATSG
ncbi:MAG: hypothetical protein GTO63_02500 [Anaerolineae bacterium]|nr:hypothetical protein [Anaerolineae bacterium]